MDREFSDFISAVLDKTDIVALISRYTKVERKGNTFWACCPFHHETQPSFSVSADKQLFHCFGCKESGNALSFLMKIENVEFIDALKMLAEQAGMEMPKPKGREYTRERMDKSRRELLYRLLRDAARHYHDNLSSPRAKSFNDYIRARNIPDGMVRKFGLGASLDFNEMLEFLKSKGYTYQDMYEAGIAENKDGRYYDVFGKRLMFPVIDNMNNVIAFGGRTLEKDAHFAKYRNSSETNFFEKSQVIYGINLLKKKKAVMPIDSVIVAEGYMDVIALHKAGFDTAVATMGTAFNTKQARQLRLYSDRVYISYDGDTAGQKAIMRGLDILKDAGFTVKVVRLPDGLDPDEIIGRDGPQGYQKLLDEAVTLTDHKLNVLKSGYDLADPDQRAQFAVEAVAIVKGLDNAVEQSAYIDKVSELTGFPVDALRRQADLAEIAKKMQPRGADTQESQAVKLDDNMKFFLASIVQVCDYIDFDMVVTDAMPNEFTARLYDWCRTHKGYTTVDIFNEYGYENELLNELVEYKPIPGDNRKRFADIENALYRKVIDKEIKRLNAMTDKNGRDPAIVKRISELYLEQAKLKNYRN